jgi:hypothetical protein
LFFDSVKEEDEVLTIVDVCSLKKKTLHACGQSSLLSVEFNIFMANHPARPRKLGVGSSKSLEEVEEAAAPKPTWTCSFLAALPLPAQGIYISPPSFVQADQETAARRGEAATTEAASEALLPWIPS